MRVLMTADTVGGVWVYALELARALEAHGVEVALATMGAPITPAQRVEAEEVASLRLYESDYKLEWMEEPWDDVARSGEWLLALEREFRPAVVHLNGFAHGALPFSAPMLVVGHSCVLSWWEAVKGEPAPAEWDRYRAEVQRGIACADLVVAPTRAMLNALDKHYGPFGARRVIYNGRDSSRFSRNGEKEERLLALGRLWDEGKNIGALAQAAESLRWPVYVAGDEKHPADGGSDTGWGNLRSLGKLSSGEVAQQLAVTSIYVLPARYEPFGLSALEAALSGCALVLGDIPSLREVWGDAALFVHPSDIHTLTSCLQMLIENPTERERLAHGAYARATLYTPKRMAAEYMEAYGVMRS
jgi:glycogen synthase